MIGWHGSGILIEVILIIIIIITIERVIAILKVRKNVGQKIYLTEQCTNISDVIFLFMLLGVVVTGYLADNKLILLFLMTEIKLIPDDLRLSQKLQTYTIVRTDKFCMYSLYRKKLCTVDTNEKIYYAIIRAKVKENLFDRYHRYTRKKYIIFSNKPFEYDNAGIFKNRKLLSYDMKTQIAMPYNKNTMSLFELENWNNVIKKDIS